MHGDAEVGRVASSAMALRRSSDKKKQVDVPSRVNKCPSLVRRCIVADCDFPSTSMTKYSGQYTKVSRFVGVVSKDERH
jgi:hypothetical protein